METPAIRKQERELAVAKSTEVNDRTTALQRWCEKSEGNHDKHHE